MFYYVLLSGGLGFKKKFEVKWTMLKSKVKKPEPHVYFLLALPENHIQQLQIYSDTVCWGNALYDFPAGKIIIQDS